MSFYQIAVVALIERDGKILIGKKKKRIHLLSKMWHIPGGKKKPNEAEEEALVREMKEELGLKIRVNKFLAQKNFPKLHKKTKWYLCSPLTDKIKPGDDLAEAKYVSKKNIFETCHPKAISLWPSKVVSYLKKIKRKN